MNENTDIAVLDVPNPEASKRPGRKPGAKPAAKPTTIERTQQVAPRFQMDKDRHYVRIQGDTPEFDSPLPEYLTKPSPTDPDEFMYRLESEDPRITGKRNVSLLSCSMADYKAMMQGNDYEAKGRESQVKSDETFKRSKGLIDPND